MIVKCMRPQNPNFSEEKMGLISAKKSIKTMVPYNGPALVEGSVLVGRTLSDDSVVKNVVKILKSLFKIGIFYFIQILIILRKKNSSFLPLFQH